MKRNQSIYARQIERQNVEKETLKPQDFIDSETIEKKRTHDRYKRIQEFTSRAEEIAKSSVFYKNHYYTSKHFPDREILRRVSKFFPYADGGPLYIDEPQYANEKADCRMKTPVMKELGLRYLVIEEDDTLYDLIEKLKDQKKEMKQ